MQSATSRQLVILCLKYTPTAHTIRYRQIFSGGYRTKMKIWSENFLRAYSAQKRGSQIFHLRRAFFVVEALKAAKKPLKTVTFS